MKLPPVEFVNLPYDLNSRPIPAHMPYNQRLDMRKLPFNRAHNFRDIGGYLSADGRSVKWGMMYRADKLSKLSDDDQAYLERLDIRRVIDFRSNEERQEAPHSLLAHSKITIHPLPVSVEAAQIEKISRHLQEQNSTPEQMERFLLEANREMVERFSGVFKNWIAQLLDEKNYPQVFHCTAGKDRTGFAAAVLLTALDVPRETVMEDYLATNHFTKRRIEQAVKFLTEHSLYQVNADVVRTLFGVQAHYLNEAFKTMEEKYHSVEQYLEIGLGIGQAEKMRLQALLLEEPQN